MAEFYDVRGPFFENGYAIILKDEKYGMINDKEKIIVPCKYDDIDYFHCGLARVKKNNKFGFHKKIYDLTERFQKFQLGFFWISHIRCSFKFWLYYLH